MFALFHKKCLIEANHPPHEDRISAFTRIKCHGIAINRRAQEPWPREKYNSMLPSRYNSPYCDHKHCYHVRSVIVAPANVEISQNNYYFRCCNTDCWDLQSVPRTKMIAALTDKEAPPIWAP